MIRRLLPLLLLIACVSLVGAAESSAGKYVIDQEDWGGEDFGSDYGPGDMPGGGSEGYPNCNDVGEDFIGECVEPEPATAPDNCIYYDAFPDPSVYLVWGCG